MKKKMIASAVAAVSLCCVFAFSQQQKATQATHKVVLELNTSAGWDQVLNNVVNIQHAFKDDGVQVEVVFFGQGLAMLLKTDTEYAQRLKEAADKGVVLAACQNSMRARNIKSEDLLPFSTEVDSGAAELVRKQEAGWAYIRGGE